MSQQVQASIQYSFPKAQRFRRLHTPCSTDYYEPNYFRSTRASGFGYGNKFDFTKMQSYTESFYDPTSSFSNNKGASFGLSRNMVKNRSYLQYNSVPGPGSYFFSPKKSIGYSIGQRVGGYHHTTEMPGPGAYDPNIYKNRSISINKGPDRFSTESTFFPGPGEYNAQLIQTQTKCRFGSAKRKCFIDDAIRAAKKSGVPGPGNYATITQFVQLDKQKSRPSTAKH
ncbi:unnamed protein product [Paramecium pentaurelia]|uniref:Uncharacterized protein n=1 Tax=Paramecium pentaurelia TaxID=43138 RepID=A0A8S1WZZ0_9CILI|nr:unnamed protein product [Paramecium pentaurelia]